MAEELAPESNLLLQIMEYNARDSAFITNQLMDGYKRERDEAWAELRLIRSKIIYLLDQDFAPSARREDGKGMTPDELDQLFAEQKAAMIAGGIHFKDNEFRASFERGMAQSLRGQVSDLGDFKQYLSGSESDVER